MTEEMSGELLEAGIDFNGIAARIPGREEFILRLLSKFPNEKCYEGLREAMENKDYEEAFKNAHNLKGVTANLEMPRLYQATCYLVEKLRAHDYEGVDEDFKKISEEYEQVINAINRIILA